MDTILVLVPIILGLSGIAAAFFFGGKNRSVPRPRPTKGTVRSFDSVPSLVEHCRERYRTDQVRTLFEGRDFVVQVDRPGGRSFEAIVTHSEEKDGYSALLPDIDDGPAPSA